MFAALACGIATGVGGYNIVVVGTVGFCVAAFILYHSPFGQTGYYDDMLRFDEIILCPKNRENISKVLISTLQNLYNSVHEQQIIFTWRGYI